MPTYASATGLLMKRSATRFITIATAAMSAGQSDRLQEILKLSSSPSWDTKIEITQGFQKYG